MPVIDLPTPGDDDDVWGAKLNVAIAAVNAAVDALGAGVSIDLLPPGSVAFVDFTGPGEPTRPAVAAGVKVWWTGPFFPAAALVGDKVDLTA
jgi:hypothetical protein